MPHTKKCPGCGGPGFYMGSLGFLRWYRCEDCGATFSSKTRKPKTQRKENQHGNH